MQANKQAVRAREDEPFLERFIQAHDPFILRTASKYAGFSVTRSDDEYSVALYAFYEAIKSFDPDSGPFGAYAALVIRRRLTDHYRSLRRFDPEILLAPQVFDGAADQDSEDASMQQVVWDKIAESADEGAAWEIEAAGAQFAQYGFRLEDLSACAPRAEKTRRECARAIATLLQQPELMRELKRAHRLPVKKLAAASRTQQPVVERHRKYIIAAALLLTGDYPRLCACLPTIRQQCAAVRG